MERDDQKRLAEALIAASPEPISALRISKLVPGATLALARGLVEELNAAYLEQGRSFEIGEVAGGYQLRTLPEFGAELLKLQNTRPLRLSQAALETLAVVAYRQPATRAEVENVRGVDVGAVLRSLLERKLVRIAGHKEAPGRPMLYATTPRFLEVLGLARLEDLPALRELEDLAREAEPPPGAAEAPDDAAAADPEDGRSAGELAAFEDAEPVGEPH